MTDYNIWSDEEISALLAETLGEDYETYTKVSAELREESPRASVIVGAAWLDEKLAALIEQALHDDERVRKVFTKPFRTFGYRIDIAYQLGFIGLSEKEGFEVIREIRNEFAHEILASFNDRKVKELVLKLEPYIPVKSKPMKEPQEWYVYAVSYMHGYISTRVRSAREERDVTTRLDMLRYLAEKWPQEFLLKVDASKR